MDLPYTLKRRKNTRSLSLSIELSGKVVLCAPRWVSQRDIARFFASHVDWVRKKQDELEQRAIDPDLRVQTNAHFERYKHRARACAVRKVTQWNAVYGFDYARVRVSRMRTRWGSCSEDGRLNFNYKILFLPEPLQDYLVVHELCHLKQMNHSSAFWHLVSLAIPAYTSRKRELAKLGR